MCVEGVIKELCIHYVFGHCRNVKPVAVSPGVGWGGGGLTFFLPGCVSIWFEGS